ncbi:hypothetical protein ACMGLB_004720 [Salmonella enterica subsp. enterica serovar Schwarzengrund]
MSLKWVSVAAHRKPHRRSVTTTSNVPNIVLPAPKVFSSESLPHNFNMAAVGVMKKGMSMSLFSSPGNTVVSGHPCAGKTNLTAELISAVVGSNKKGEGQ